MKKLVVFSLFALALVLNGCFPVYDSSAYSSPSYSGYDVAFTVYNNCAEAYDVYLNDVYIMSVDAYNTNYVTNVPGGNYYDIYAESYNDYFANSELFDADIEWSLCS
jgi:hypothetical protein